MFHLAEYRYKESPPQTMYSCAVTADAKSLRIEYEDVVTCTSAESANPWKKREYLDIRGRRGLCEKRNGVTRRAAWCPWCRRWITLGTG